MARKKVAVWLVPPYFHIVRLQQGTALVCPVLLEFEDDLLEGEHGSL